MSKTVLGQGCTLWRNNSAPVPFELMERLGLRPGDKFQYVDCGDHIEVEKM